MRKPRQREYSHRCESSFLAVLAALFVVRYVSWSRFLKVLKATLQNYGRLYIRRAGNNLGYAMLPRLFPLYRLFYIFRNG